MADFTSRKTGLFSDQDTWNDGLSGSPTTATHSFDVVSGHVVTLDQDFATSAGNGQILSGGAMIIDGGYEISVGGAGQLNVVGTLTITNGGVVMPSAQANLGISQSAGIITIGPAGYITNTTESNILAGSVYLRGGTITLNAGGIMSVSAFYMESGTITIPSGGFTYFTVANGGFFEHSGGDITLSLNGYLRIDGSGKYYARRRGLTSPIDASQAYGITGRPVRIGV